MAIDTTVIPAPMHLSNLEIDVDKDWNGRRISNLGMPLVDGDALRVGNALSNREMARGGVGQVLTGEGLGSAPSYKPLPLVARHIKASPSDIIAEAPTRRTVSGTHWWTVKKVQLHETGTFRITFDFRSGSGVADAQIFRNGSAHGMLHQRTSTTFILIEELLPFNAQDFMQLRIRSTGTVVIQNLTVMARMVPTAHVDLD